MLRHYYTLTKINRELQPLVGCESVERFSQEKNTVILVFSAGQKAFHLQFSADPSLGSIFLRSNFVRAKKNTVELFPCLSGEILQETSLLHNNRIIRFRFINTDLYAVLFGGAKNNLFAVNFENIILDAFKHRADFIGKEFSIPPARLKNFSEFSPDTPLIEALERCDALLGKYYAKELCLRNAIDPRKQLSSFNPEELTGFETEISGLRGECLKSKEFFLLRSASKDVVLSLIPLIEFPEIIGKYSSINEAVEHRVIRSIVHSKFKAIYNGLSRRLGKEEKKLQGNIDRAQDLAKSRERAEQYRIWAELLVSQPNPKIKSGSTVKLTDFDGGEVVIPLDEKLTLMENSAKYFKKAKAAKVDIEVRKERLPELELRIGGVRDALEKLEYVKTLKEIESFKKNLKQSGVKNVSEDKQSPGQKYRTFELGEGYTLYVGKSAANNDELTMKFAKPNDLWFHARGAGGSHVVLRIPKGMKPPKHIIMKAAATAAYYSRARKAKYAPVAYSFKKYVRKPKGANPGTVVMSREEVIMVEPSLPERIS